MNFFLQSVDGNSAYFEAILGFVVGIPYIQRARTCADAGNTVFKATITHFQTQKYGMEEECAEGELCRLVSCHVMLVKALET